MIVSTQSQAVEVVREAKIDVGNAGGSGSAWGVEFTVEASRDGAPQNQSGRAGLGVEERHIKFSVKEASGNYIAHREGNLEDFQVTVDQIVDGRCVVCGYDESTCFAVSVTARNRDDRNVSVVAMPKSALNR